MFINLVKLKDYTLLIILLTIFFICLLGQATAANIAATVISLKGSVVIEYPDGKSVNLKKGDEVIEHAVIKSSKSSFAKLLFIDKSTMNIGPGSSIEVAMFVKNKPGVIKLMGGEIRSKVTKNYMNINNKNRSKLLIRTPTAAMGVRGTDFIVSVEKNISSFKVIEGTIVVTPLKNINAQMGDKLVSFLDNKLNSNKSVKVTANNMTTVTTTSKPQVIPLSNEDFLSASEKIIDNDKSDNQKEDNNDKIIESKPVDEPSKSKDSSTSVQQEKKIVKPEGGSVVEINDKKSVTIDTKFADSVLPEDLLKSEGVTKDALNISPSSKGDKTTVKINFVDLSSTKSNSPEAVVTTVDKISITKVEKTQTNTVKQENTKTDKSEVQKSRAPASVNQKPSQLAPPKLKNNINLFENYGLKTGVASRGGSGQSGDIIKDINNSIDKLPNVRVSDTSKNKEKIADKIKKTNNKVRPLDKNKSRVKIDFKIKNPPTDSKNKSKQVKR